MSKAEFEIAVRYVEIAVVTEIAVAKKLKL